jgi:hypothetical protein
MNIPSVFQSSNEAQKFNFRPQNSIQLRPKALSHQHLTRYFEIFAAVEHKKTIDRPNLQQQGGKKINLKQKSLVKVSRGWNYTPRSW